MLPGLNSGWMPAASAGRPPTGSLPGATPVQPCRFMALIRLYIGSAEGVGPERGRRAHPRVLSCRLAGAVTWDDRPR